MTSFSVCQGRGDFASKNKNSPPRSNSITIINISPFNVFNVAVWAQGGGHLDILVTKSTKVTKTGPIAQVGPRGGRGVMRELTIFS